MFGCYATRRWSATTSQVFYESAEEWERVGSEASSADPGRRHLTRTRSAGRGATANRSGWQVTGRLVDPADEAKGTIWVIDDVDARHRAEDGLKSALIEETAPMDTATVGIVFSRTARS